MSTAVALAVVLCAAAVAAHAATLTVSVNTDSAATTSNPGDGPGQTGDLRSAILNSNTGDTIQFNCGSPCVITLNGPLPPITQNLTIDGGTLGNVIIDGNGTYRVFFVDTGDVQLENLQIENARAKGGDGGSGGSGCGGGGAGLGAGLFVNGVTAAANVTLTNVFFLDDSAIGGNGCTASGGNGAGGGGGLGGNGGNGEYATIPNGYTNGGGGGVLGPGANGDTGDLNGSAGGEGGGGGSSTNVGSGIPGLGGSGYGANSAGGSSSGYNGGNGGFGGGGGSGSITGGDGGFGGGGGGGGTSGVNGGAGGGGGSSNFGGLGSGGVLMGAVGGGNAALVAPSSSSSSGGGAAAGPDIFVNQGTLVAQNTGSTGASAAGGVGGSGAGNGGADATPVFNYIGTVNGSSATGPVTGAVTNSPVPTFTVTSTADSGTGSLREALASAAVDGGANITFDSSVFAATNTAAQNTITLASALTIPSNTTIQGLTSGSGASSTNLVTVSGQNSTSLFTVTSAGASIANLNLTDGNGGSIQGGAINQYGGTLTISNSTFSGSSANGYQGGAIYQNGGALTISGSTFEDNSGIQGGAIFAALGTLTVSNSTFGNNTASLGTAIFLDSETMTLSGSTFSGNSGEGAICNDNGTLTMSNTILAGNSGGDGVGTFGGGNNLVGDGTGIGGITNGSNGNQVGTSASPINPMLTALGNYGGPTQTMVPLPGSPAICAGSNGSLPSGDQRGFARTTTYGSTTCADVGAVQTNYSLAFSTQPPSTVAAGAPFSAGVTLSESGAPFAQPGIGIEMALTGGASLGTATTSSIGVASFSNLSVNTEGDLDSLTASLALSSVSISQISSTFTVTAGAATYFSVSAPASVMSYVAYPIIVTALDTYGNVATGYTGTVHLTSTDPGFVDATGNIALTNGVGTFNVGLKQAGLQTITATDTVNSSITGTSNSIVVNPGPVARLTVSAPATASVGGQFEFTVTANDLYGNVATSYTGTVHFTSTDASAALPANSTLTNGTGLFSVTLNTQGSQTITATDTVTSTITGTSNGITISIPSVVVTSTADSGAGSLRAALATAAANGSGNITFDPAVFATPQTITLSSGTLSIPSNTTIAGATSGSGATLQNLVTVSGGGSSSNFSIFTVNSGVTNAAISNLTIANGYVNSQGGGIYSSGSLTVTGCTFSNNYAAGVPDGGNGGGAIYANSGVLTVSDTTFSGNTSAPGGAMNVNDGTVTIRQSTFSGNSAVAGTAGGAIFINNGTLTIAGSTFSNNSAAGGGAVFNYGTLTATNTIMAGDAGGDCGAGGSNSCPANGINGNVIGVSNINLAPLGNYGGATQTMVPLPGSAAICAINPSIATGTDQRGDSRTTTYSNGGTPFTCQDAGAVQTDYAITFSTEPEPISPATSTLVDTNFEAGVTLTESGNAFTGASVSIPLTLASSPSGATLSNGTESTGTGTGVATYSTLQVNQAGSNDIVTANLTLNAGLSPALILTAAGSQFNVSQAATALSFVPSPATQVYGTAITAASLNATASFGGSAVNGAFTYSTTVNGNSVTLVPGTTVLPVGSYTLTAAFTPSNTSVYTGTSITAPYNVTQAASITALQVSSTSITPGQSVTLSATVKSATSGTPTGAVNFYDNGALLNTTPAALNAGVATYATATLAPGLTHVITATYSGDANFTASSSTAGASTNITDASLDFTMTMSCPSSLTVIPGQSIACQIPVAPLYGSYSGTVNFAVSGLPPGATAAFSPSSIAPSAGPQTVTVTIQTASTAAALHRELPPLNRKLAPFGLAVLVFLGAGSLRKRSRALRGLLCVLLLVSAGAAATMLSGCGSNGGFFAQAPQNYTVTITATSGSLQHSTNITLNLQ